MRLIIGQFFELFGYAYISAIDIIDKYALRQIMDILKSIHPVVNR